MPNIGTKARHREIARLREKIEALRDQVGGLRLLIEALCKELRAAGLWPPTMAIAISYGDVPPLQDFAGKWHSQHNTRGAKALAEQGHRISSAVDAEVKRLKEIFRDYGKP